MDTKTKPLYRLSTRDLPKPRDTYRLNVRGLKGVFHADGVEKKMRVAIIISDKI